jgi:hypothetical protein
VGQPSKSLYSDEYTTDMYFCNKPDPIKNQFEYQVYQAPAKNIVYTCKNKIDGNTSFNTIINNEIKQISAKNPNIYIKPYDMKELLWPVVKKDVNPNYVNIDDYTNKLVLFDYDPSHEYQGTYLYDNKCVENTPLFDCLKKCTITNGCKGVEYDNKTNKCCPKSSIDNRIKRTDENKDGAFYTKKLANDAYIGNIYITQNN